MAIIVATLLLFLAGPFVLWPLLKTPGEGYPSSPAGPAFPVRPGPSVGATFPGKRGREAEPPSPASGEGK